METPSPLQQAHQLVLQASDLARDFLHGTPDAAAKQRARAIANKISNIDTDEIPHGQVEATHTALKAARMLVDGVNRAAFSHNEFRTQMKAIIKACLPLKDIALAKVKGVSA